MARPATPYKPGTARVTDPRRAATTYDHRALPGRGGGVSPVFWVAAACLAVALVARLPIDGPRGTMIATLVFIAGGMPHGAYDIALLARATRLGRYGLALAIGGYVAVAVVMALLWVAAPLFALILFLAVASVHFGEDWTMLDEPLLRVAAGAAIICAAAIGHPDEVAGLFAAMTGDQRGATLARVAVAVAPVALLVTAVGILVAWRDGARRWAGAMGLAIVGLIVAPPVAGFALFFVFLHAPLHLHAARLTLAGISRRRWVVTGAGMAGTAVLGWLIFAAGMARFLPSEPTAQAFQLLATVAVPHLLFSRWIERRVERHESDGERAREGSVAERHQRTFRRRGETISG